MTHPCSVEPPRFLYRYRSLKTPYSDEELRRAIVSQELYLTSALQVNDPFEFSPHLSYDRIGLGKHLRSPAGIKKPISKKKYEQQFGAHVPRNEFRKIIKESEKSTSRAAISHRVAALTHKQTRSRMKLACFSETSESIPMWAHYAGHDGVCVKYEFLLDDFKVGTRTFEELLAPLPVVYTDQRPKVTSAELLRFASSDLKDTIDDHEKERTFTSLFLSKSSDWKYEKEWRVFSEEPPTSSYCKTPLLKVSSLIFGINTEKDTIEKYFRNYGGDVEIQTTSIAKSRYGLDFSRH